MKLILIRRTRTRDKGTQAARLVEALWHCSHFHRRHAERGSCKGTELGNQAKSIMAAGGWFPMN